MNQSDIIRMAKEAGINFKPAGAGDDGIDTWYGDQYLPSGSLLRFASLVAAEKQEENDMLRRVNNDLGIEAETAEALLNRWVAFYDTSTRSEPFKCIAEDSRRWIKAANALEDGTPPC